MYGCTEASDGAGL